MEFQQLCDDREAEWQPQSRTERFYLEQMTVSQSVPSVASSLPATQQYLQWKLTRMEVGEIDIFEQPVSGKDQISLLDRLWQAQCRIERSYARAQRELERLQKTRSEPAEDHVDAPPPEAAEASIDSAAPATFPGNPERALGCRVANGAVSDQPSANSLKADIRFLIRVHSRAFAALS